jgi:glutaredoxin
MRRTVALLSLLLVLTLVATPAFGAQKAEPWIVVFHEEGCPDCAQMEELLAGLTIELPDSAIVRYDISDPEALDLLIELARAYDVETSSVPVVFVGDDVAVLGVGRAQEFELRNAIGECTIQGCSSPLARAPSRVFRTSLLRLTLFAVLFALLLWWQTS